MIYNSKLKEILVVHNSPDTREVTFIDAETMTATRTKTFDFNIYALAYDSVNDCYFAEISIS